MLPIVPTHAAQATNIKAHKTRPIIEHTSPAVAIPVGFFFLANTPNTTPIIPVIKPTIISPGIKLNTIDTIPKTKKLLLIR